MASAERNRSPERTGGILPRLRSPARRPVFFGDVKMKRCTKCGKTLPLEQFSRMTSASGGLRGPCRACASVWYHRYYAANKTALVARSQRYHATHRGEEAASARRYRSEHPEIAVAFAQQYSAQYPCRLSAKRAVASAIRNGKLVRPNACELCGSEGYLHAHHADYSRPLDVTFLCVPCHKTVHAIANTFAANVAEAT